MTKKTRFSDLPKKHADLASETAPEAQANLSTPEAPTLPTAKPKPRPSGKKSDPNYTQVTIYLRKDRYATARKRLFDERKQFSDLVGELLDDWIETVQKSKQSEV